MQSLAEQTTPEAPKPVPMSRIEPPSPQPSDEERRQRALEAFDGLMLASKELSAHLQRKLQEEGLTTSQMGVLDTILHLGPMCQRDIGEHLNKSRGNVTTVVDNLERRDLVKRVRNKSDRRFITLHLTEKGRELTERIYPEHVRRIVEMLAAISEDEQRSLIKLCHKLADAVDREG